MANKDKGGGKTSKKTASATLKQKRQAKRTKKEAAARTQSISGTGA